MRRKPRNERNLTKRSGVWYHQGVVGGRRIRFSTETRDKKLAVSPFRE